MFSQSSCETDPLNSSIHVPPIAKILFFDEQISITPCCALENAALWIALKNVEGVPNTAKKVPFCSKKPKNIFEN